MRLTKIIRFEFLLKSNKEKRKWFFSKFSQEKRNKFREEYYKYMEEHQVCIPMFIWFEINAFNKKKIEHPFITKSIMWK